MKKIYLVLTLALVCVFSESKAQLYAYLDNPTGAYAGISPNMTATNLNRYNGLLEDPACGVGFSSNKHTTSGYTNGRPGVQFTLTPDAGFEITVTAISVDVRRNPKGPALWRIAYSTDGGATWTNNGTDISVASSGCFTNTEVSWDVDDFTSNTPVIIRIIGHSAFSSLNGVSTLRNIDVQGTVQFTDADGDGFTSDADCNDANAAINPGAAEICNGIDENCNGFIDEGAGDTWYADADGDGFGDAAMTEVACAAPAGYVADNTDCNDADAAVNPGAAEVCNEVDDDCNGTIDDGLTLFEYFIDADGDGYGNPSESILTCFAAPDGFVDNGNDCNDANADINPAASEICNAIDDNCDGFVDEGIDLSIAINPTGDIILCKPDDVTLEATAGFTSYQWYKNGSPLAGATAATYTTNKPAFYQVEGFTGTCTSGLSAVQAVAVVESPNANISTPDGNNLCVVNPALIKASFGDLYTYVWYKDGVEIAGASSFQYEATETGDYYCVITNENNCTRTTATISIINECREGMAEASMLVYPNPAQSVLNISMSGLTAEVATINLTDITGRVVYTIAEGVVSGSINTAIALDDAFVNGVYMLQVVAGDVQMNRQCIIAR